jgi:DNA-binding transcriptional MerR regulator
MRDDELMTIGRFARVSGLSIHALRHYAEVGLLTPAETDPGSGYRRYRREQVRIARMIRALRCIDLPIDGIRQILDGGDDASRDVLTQHRRRLEGQQSLLAAQLGDVDRYLKEGLPMPTIQSGCRPVQIKLAVADRKKAVEFLQAAFGLRYTVIRRTEDGDYSDIQFGEYGRDDFFLLNLLDDPAHTDQPGATTFGLLVDDLDATHSQALAAGGTEAVAPHSPEGMPRCSAVNDPDGNWIWLYQG